MKTGIITLAQGNDNYGGTLQAVAMQEILRRMGCEPVLLNAAQAERPFRPLRLLRHPLREIQMMRRYKAFEEFWSRHMRWDSGGHRSAEEFIADPTPVDACVVGSDQIWGSNYMKTEAGRNFVFCNFGGPEMKRIAYSPSFGRDRIDDGEIGAIAPLVKKFDALSCREKSGVEILGKFGRDDALLTADPVLLPERDFWSGLADESEASGKGVIFYPAYRWKTATDAGKLLKMACAETGCRLAVPYFERPLDFIGANISATPADWLKLIRDSEYVVTNSFHAMMFSVIFRKKFAVLPLAGGYARSNGRIKTAAEHLGLEDRLSESAEDALAALKREPDWAAVEMRIAKWREESLAYLENALRRQ